MHYFQIMDDPLQSQRLAYIIDDCEIENSETDKNEDIMESSKVHGLLALVKNNQITDSRRSYQCIKTLVNAANKSPAVKEKLLRDPEKWQWAVNWLKDKMSQGMSATGNTDVSRAAENSNYWTTSTSDGLGGIDVVSNEDATSTRIFHRTTSAQVILEEANALLAEFGETSMNDNENSVLMSSIVSEDKNSLHPSHQNDANSVSPASSPSVNRHLAVVPDIDPEIGSSVIDHMDTDNCEIDGQAIVGKDDDSEMPDLINDNIKIPAVPKTKIRTSRNSQGTSKGLAGGLLSDRENRSQDWDFDAVD